MSKWIKGLCIVGCATLVLASSVYGQQPGGQRGQRGGFQRSPTQLPRQIELSDEQKTKIADIEKKYADKLKEAQDKAKLTDEQTAARRAAMTKAREDGKSFEEMRTIMTEAVKLTDEQKKGQEALTALTKEITTEVEGVLTDEQKAKLKEIREQAGQRGGQRGQRGARPAPST